MQGLSCTFDRTIPKSFKSAVAEQQHQSPAILRLMTWIISQVKSQHIVETKIIQTHRPSLLSVPVDRLIRTTLVQQSPTPRYHEQFMSVKCISEECVSNCEAAYDLLFYIPDWLAYQAILPNRALAVQR